MLYGRITVKFTLTYKYFYGIFQVGAFLESWLSGLRRTTGNRVTAYTRSRVQIPDSPPVKAHGCLADENAWHPDFLWRDLSDFPWNPLIIHAYKV